MYDLVSMKVCKSGSETGKPNVEHYSGAIFGYPVNEIPPNGEVLEPENAIFLSCVLPPILR